jgi:tRNA pseudouridine13 synthase
MNIVALPFLTPTFPGVGGRVKVEPADFEVEEIPAYEPSGSGDHRFLWIEKTDMGAEYFIRKVGLRLGIPTGEVGTAGLKDRRAITRQWLSVPASCESSLAQLEGDGIRVLRVARHATNCGPVTCGGIAFAFSFGM